MRVAALHSREILPDERAEFTMRVMALLRQIKKKFEPARVLEHGIGRAQARDDGQIVGFILARKGGDVTPLVGLIERPLEPQNVAGELRGQRERIDEAARSTRLHKRIDYRR